MQLFETLKYDQWDSSFKDKMWTDFDQAWLKPALLRQRSALDRLSFGKELALLISQLEAVKMHNTAKCIRIYVSPGRAILNDRCDVLGFH